jgi:sec-independent protein translocase protein TatA
MAPLALPLIFDISGGELLLILLFVLLFFGSKGIPGIARTLGRTLRQVRDASAEVQREIQRGATDVKQGFDAQRKAFRIEPPEHAAPRPVPPASVEDGATEVGGEQSLPPAEKA